jgi:hypothetical protein
MMRSLGTVVERFKFLGTMFYVGGDKYEGKWSNDKKNGKGKILLIE